MRTQGNTVETFLRVKALVHATQGSRVSLLKALRSYGMPKVLPHLTELWFRRAEPTKSQLASK